MHWQPQPGYKIFVKQKKGVNGILKELLFYLVHKNKIYKNKYIDYLNSVVSTTYHLPTLNITHIKFTYLINLIHPLFQ